ncbi:putative bifunctional diguanylate cyclase/phosphodiesterase [Thalassotalea euphylliae]|uniref:putative bifunctional diguanylate cyclase/phosphodiesterase n=1 Tax=Thalassotalea euphylliae TaxID=1655234 RepID=UPI0036453BD2
MKVKRDLVATRRVIAMTSLILLALVLWNAYSAIRLHLNYQSTLMDSVTNSVLADYQEHITMLRSDIDRFQFNHADTIAKLSNQGELASKEMYMSLLQDLKESIDEVRLFAIVDKQGNGVLKHITGDFLDDCKEEIHSTVSLGTQEHLFLHRSSKSIHFDLLEPLAVHDKSGWFFFVAFNTAVFESLLTKYQLPHQQLFLLRSDSVGKIELSTTTTVDQSLAGIVMSAEEVQTFTHVKEIPGTRWQIAIRLAPEYQTSIYLENLTKAWVIWVFVSLIIFTFYRLQKTRIRQQRAAEKALAHSEAHDALTGLINRARFEQELNDFVASSLTDGKEGVVVLVDIDQFQLVNNSYGYSTGDNLLHQTSMHIAEQLPSGAQFSRLGNDEFAVLLPELSHSEAYNFAEKMRKSIGAINYEAEQQTINITASIGVLHIDGVQRSSEHILNSLAQAVRIAKEKGRNRIQVYQSEDKALVQHAQEMAVVKDIDKALSENRLMLYRQHINALQGDINIPKYEVLVRLKNKDGDIIPPNLFIPASEKFGLITKVDRWVIEATCKSIADTGDNGHYSINLSGMTLADKDIIEFVHNIFAKYDINPARIGFEITETYAITHLKSAIRFITEMTNMGCEFSLDDFGSGLSSFSYLQQLPVHHIKIDGSFIRDICNNRLNQVFVETMHNVAKEMGKDCIAEFVEDEQTQLHLQSIGIEFAQGFYHHRPEHWFEY